MNNSKTFIFIFIAIVLVYICGLPIDVMEVDAAQYATISSEMFGSGNYLHIYCRGYDYLDKPPFLFWINQIFFFLFGVHDWSFKLGSLLCVLLGIYSTYRLGKLLYDKNTGLISAVIVASTQAWFLMTQDVKTDGILISAITFTVWQWKSFALNKKWSHLIFLSVGIAVGMLTKGPLGFAVPAMVICSDLAVNGQWKMLFGQRKFEMTSGGAFNPVAGHVNKKQAARFKIDKKEAGELKNLGLVSDFDDNLSRESVISAGLGEDG